MDIAKILEKISEIILKQTQLEERIRKIEESSISTGIYLEGCPDYAVDYITDKKKEGE